ncbi:LOW QUALITY PROTEIN: reverse transcriptase [Phytophthora megakarya]|uniref:Reverse transcriptase n=1 Tax=Phytophthora megakarya TaxID=4795 RepID=A0A225VWQ4_9STRA|nr:LOW QUALITY PROTEIN: reverse transcriptase [Phytophthora megakarya]
MTSVQSGTGHAASDPLNDKCATSMSQKTDMDPSPVVEDQPGASDLDLTWDSDQDYEECVYYHEGSDLYVEDVNEAVLPEVPGTTEEVKIEDIQLCGSDDQTPKEIDRLRQRIWMFRHLLIGKGNALPPATRGVVCDIDVGGGRSIALKCRKLRTQFREKLADLIKGLLSAKMINYSRSPWASPIVAIIKKGVDIRLLTQLMIYPMPLINDLLEDLKSTLGYCSLDMASGFWVVKMTDRARLISAFFYHSFWWNRMPFGLKDAPQIYQRMIDNALYRFTRIPKSEDHGSILDVFEDGEQVEPGKPSVLGLEGLLEASDKWNLSISVVKSFWGMPKVEYLDHKANPKDLSALTDLAFPGSLSAMQSFLGSLNYYIRFIEDYANYASVLYELWEIDFAAMMKDTTQTQIQRILDVESVDQGSQEDQAIDHRKTLDLEAQDLTEVDPRWIHAYRSFSVLKTKFATTPILRHFDPDRSATIVVYASDWDISGSLMQEYDKIYYPVMFARRTLKSNEPNYGIAEKEVLALLRILDLNYNALVGRPIRMLTRHSTLAWLFRSTALQGRLGQWAALLSPWTLEITKCVKGEDEILGELVGSTVPRSHADKTLISIAPKKEPRRKIQAPIHTIGSNEDLYVVSFDGSARVKRGCLQRDLVEAI